MRDGALPAAPLLVIVALTVAGAELEVRWNMVETVHSTSLVTSDVRVAKVNRTLAALRGTVNISAPLGNDILISCEFFHSPLGNSQFTKTPYRMPLLGVCDFMRVFLVHYRHFFDENIVNFPASDECPVQPRTITLRDRSFDAAGFPDGMRPGLWKGVLQLLHAVTLGKVFEEHLYFVAEEIN